MNKPYTFESISEMKAHALTNRLTLVAYKSVVYDVTEFLYDSHQGEPNTILQFANQSIDNVLFNETHFRHKPEVIFKLEPLKYGYIGRITEPTSVKLIKSEKKIQGQSNVQRTRRFLNFEVEEKASSLSYVDQIFQNKSQPMVQIQLLSSITYIQDEPKAQFIPLSQIRKFLKQSGCICKINAAI